MVRVVLLLLFPTLAWAAEPAVLVDPDATTETRALFENLRRLAPDKLLFGHQHTTEYGVGWKGDPDRSDVKSTTGAYPAVYGWDFFDPERTTLERGPKSMHGHIMAAYARGGVNTICWHADNPVTGKNFYDTTPAVPAILPGGAKHAEFLADLDAIAAFAKALVDEEGTLVPIIFRPFHEHDGAWFWWGAKHCTAEEFIALWRFTVTYLRDEKGVHNFLYAYSPSIGYPAREDYFARYPGDAFVDVLGLDAYVKSMKRALPALRTLVEEAETRGKLAALTEGGYPDGMSKTGKTDYYMNDVLKPIESDATARRLSFLLVWRNASTDHYWAPYPGSAGADDFRAFRAHPFTLFGDTLDEVYTEFQPPSPQEP